MAEATVSTKPDTIVMIHGLWMTPRSWEHWKARYEDRGYKVHRRLAGVRGRGRGAERRPLPDGRPPRRRR